MAVPSVVIGPGRALDAYSIRARWTPVASCWWILEGKGAASGIEDYGPAVVVA